MHDECSSCRKLLVVISVTGELRRDSTPWKATRVGKINTHEPGEEQGCHVSLSPPGKRRWEWRFVVFGRLCDTPSVPYRRLKITV